MPNLPKFMPILLLCLLPFADAIIIRSPRAHSLTDMLNIDAKPSSRKLMTRHHINHRRAAKFHKRRLQYYDYDFDDDDDYTSSSNPLGIQTSLHWADFFIVIAAVFIGVLIADFVKNMFSSSRENKQVNNDSVYRYSEPPNMGGFRARKLSNGPDNRRLRAMNRKINAGEGKLAGYINRVLFNKHNVRIPRAKLFRELKHVKHYFDSSGFSMPEQLTERSLYSITKNVFWNLHHYNMESKHAMAAKAIHTLYGHRQTLLTTFVSSFRPV